MIIEKTKVSIRELIFYMFFAVMFGMRMWGIYESKPLYGPMLLLGFCLWGVSVLMTEHSISEYAVIAAFMAVAGIVYLRTGEKGLLLYFMLMLGMKGINEKKLFKIGAVAGLAGMAVLTFLASFGFIEDFSYLQGRPMVGEIFRRSLGFPHPNTLSSSFTIITIMIMYTVGHSDKVRMWKTSFVMMAVAVIIYLYSGSNTGLMMTVGFLVLNAFYAYRGKVGIPEKAVLILLFPFLWLSSLVGPALAKKETIDFVKGIVYNLGSRWDVGNYYWINNHLSLFGVRLINPDNIPYGIDLSQLYLFLQLGVVPFILITLLWILLLYDEVREQRISELVITFTLLVMGVSDPFLYNIGFKNLAFCFMGIWLYRQLGRISDVSFAGRKIQMLAVGSKEVELPVLRFKKADDRNRPWKLAASLICFAVLVVLSIVIFEMNPDPDYVLADKSYMEHAVVNEFDVEGHTYSEEDIQRIKAEGNVVLNYTDENEPMYTYYAHEEDKIEGGYLAPNAARMERLRLSLGIIFWGTLLIVYFRRIL